MITHFEYIQLIFFFFLREPNVYLFQYLAENFSSFSRSFPCLLNVTYLWFLLTSFGVILISMLSAGPLTKILILGEDDYITQFFHFDTEVQILIIFSLLL